jgi:hypothetical protein
MPSAGVARLAAPLRRRRLLPTKMEAAVCGQASWVVFAHRHATKGNGTGVGEGCHAGGNDAGAGSPGRAYRGVPGNCRRLYCHSLPLANEPALLAASYPLRCIARCDIMDRVK